MDVLASLAALVPLALALLERWAAAAPQRQAHEREQAYDRDLAQASHALSAGDGDMLAELFERERQRAIRRGDLDPRGPTVDQRLGELPPVFGSADRGSGDRPAP